MANKKTRVRFAPSPTGLLHVGNARTALYNWLFARKTGGDFLLRIEDTDLERSQADYETQLIEDLRWLGLEWDEGPSAASGHEGPVGPYRQSERLAIYAEHTAQLLAEGKAYRCFCTAEELEAERALAVKEHRPQVYSGRCRTLTVETIEQNLAAGQAFAVRLRIGAEPLRFHDIVRGTVEFAAETVSDPILVRSASGISSGIPVYNYDGYAWTDAAEWASPTSFAATTTSRDTAQNRSPSTRPIRLKARCRSLRISSTILGEDRERLSKRHGATSISTFREMGILPEALANYLALLGWGAEDGKTETFTLPELTKVSFSA